MPAETTNVMTFTIKPGNKLKLDPPQLRVLADKQEIILRADPANEQDLELTFNPDPATLFVGSDLPDKVVVTKNGGEVHLAIRQDLPLARRGTFERHEDTNFARAIDIIFSAKFTRAEQGDHKDIHVEC